jgi:hypothetical protein
MFMTIYTANKGGIVLCEPLVQKIRGFQPAAGCTTSLQRQPDADSEKQPSSKPLEVVVLSNFSLLLTEKKQKHSHRKPNPTHINNTPWKTHNSSEAYFNLTHNKQASRKHKP